MLNCDFVKSWKIIWNQIVNTRFFGYVTFDNTALTGPFNSCVSKGFNWGIHLPWTLSLVWIRIENKTFAIVLTVTKFFAIGQIFFLELNIEDVIQRFVCVTFAYSTMSLIKTFRLEKSLCLLVIPIFWSKSYFGK